jgi:FkbM family methyltransferase
MRIVERIIHCAGATFNPERWPLLHNLGSRLTSRLFAVTGCAYRTLGNGVEVKLAPRFRSTPETYEAEAIGAICRLTRAGCTAVDVGANIGLYTLVMGKCVGKAGKVHAFEPATCSFETLVEHVRLNGLGDVIETHHLFHEDGLQGTNRIGGSRYDGPGTVCVERRAVRLDDFFGSRDRRPDLIKIDVEGYELHVLRGAQETLKEHPCTILCEMHPPLLAELGLGWAEVSQFMREVGYRMLDLRGDPFPGFAPDQNHLVICVPEK